MRSDVHGTQKDAKWGTGFEKPSEYEKESESERETTQETQKRQEKKDSGSVGAACDFMCDRVLDLPALARKGGKSQISRDKNRDRDHVASFKAHRDSDAGGGRRDVGCR